VIAAAFGFLILRRRGVYFSLLTLALSAMLARQPGSAGGVYRLRHH